MGRQHLAFGFTTATVTALLYWEQVSTFSSPYLFIGLSVLGSLLPDIDTPESTIGRALPLLSKLCNKAGHRTFFHDIGIWAVFLLILSYFYPVTIGLTVGYLGHLFLDGLTAKGIPLFGKNIHLLPYRMKFYSNSFAAKVATFLSLFLFSSGMGFSKLCSLYGLSGAVREIQNFIKGFSSIL